MDFDLNMDSFYNNKNYEDKNFELATFTQPIPKVKLVWDITTNTYKKARGRGRPLESEEKKNKRKMKKIEMERVYKSYFKIEKIVNKFSEEKENIPPPSLKKIIKIVKKTKKKSENN